MCEENVKWVFRWSDGPDLLLATCGIWEAHLAKDVYSKGQVFIYVKSEHSGSVPDFLGEPDHDIDNPSNLMKLIQDVSKAMVQVVPCDRVYLASLNESTKHPAHFWLIPRNKDYHKQFLDEEDACGNSKNDGFNLISKLRNEFVDRQKKHSPWGTMPPCPDKDEPEWTQAWIKYAKEMEGQFRNWVKAKEH
jgi:hypothetical protein